MQRLQEPHRIGTVRDRDVDVQAAGAGECLAGVGAARARRWSTAAAGSRPTPSAGITDTSAAQKPPAALSCCAHRGRHALHVVVEQRQRGPAGPVDEVLGRSGDGVVGGDAGSERGLGDDADLVGQIVAQRPERNGLLRGQTFDQCRQLVDDRRSAPALRARAPSCRRCRRSRSCRRRSA